MKAAFYLEPSAWSSEPVLTGAEAHHAQVLRLKAGDEIVLLDGAGRQAICKIEKMAKKEVALAQLSVSLAKPPVAFAIIALALSKAARRGFFLEKAAELRAGAVWLWQAKRSQGKLSASLLSGLSAQLVAGIKQSLNPWLPEIAIFNSAESVAQASYDCDFKYLPYECENPQNMLLPSMLGLPGKTIYIIGPEGGISQEELEIFENAAFTRVSLGPAVLRCETAATLCLGLHYWASQLPGAAAGNHE